MAASAMALAVCTTALPAAAQWTVFDPTNYAENVLQAARALEQINNQITSLQNEAQMLVNQGRNLTSLPYSSLQQLQSSVSRTQSLLAQVQRISFDVQQIDQAYTTQYAGVDVSASDQALIDGAQERWRNSVGSFEDALKVQAGVVGNIDTDRVEMNALVGASQSAVGALQATQAGNQLLALQSQQLADLTAVVAAQGRAQALEQARAAAAQDQAREQLRRFMTRQGYQPHDVTMFGNN
jgi:P-type conjugative transfer protein TrbJ